MKEYAVDLLEDLYRTMVRIRLCEESLVDPICRMEVRCPCHLYSGQEAIAAGICALLNEKDYVFGNHRSHGHFLAMGGSMDQLLAEIFGRETGCSRGRGGSMHLIAPEAGVMGSAPIVAGTISLALGAALAASIRNEDRVAVSFFGDGATNEGVLFESLNFAALKKLPLLFVCENNLYSTHMPVRECRPDVKISEIGKSLGVVSLQVDGNNVLEVYEAGKEAVAGCRSGKGPVFMECLTYRLRGHVGPDDNIQGTHTDIRPEEEVSAWRRRDPITLFESYLAGKGIPETVLAGIREEAETEVAGAHRFARESLQPEGKELSRYVYG